jgi:serine/threonine protein kinase
MTNASPSAMRFGPYRIQDKLGAGGMAVVYKALNEENNTTVALKVLRASYSEDATVVERFKREAVIVNRLRHPYIVPVNAYGELKGRFYLELAYMPGGTLGARFRDRAEISPEETVRLMRNIGSALDFAHRQGVVHRDLKLENVLIDGRGNTLLSDFGIARIADDERMTATGSIVGTPLYIAPEQARGMGADYRSDLYSLAVIAYVLAVGHFPFNGNNIMAVLHQHVSEPVPLPSKVNPNLPTALDTVLLKALAKRPEERYPSADMFIEGFARAMANHRNRNTVVDLRSDPHGKPIIIEGLSTPTKFADDWVREAEAAPSREEAIVALKKALELEPLHSKANRMLFQLEGAKPLRAQTGVSVPTPVNEAELEPLKKSRPRSKTSIWTVVLYVAICLLVLASAFYAASILGLPIAKDIGDLLTGNRPVLEIGGKPVSQIPNVVLTVHPNQVRPLPFAKQIQDTLPNGITHEYVFQAYAGQTMTVSVIFRSVTGKHVSRNIAVLNSEGRDAGCRHKPINADAGDTDVIFSCPIKQAGDWRVRLFGIDGQSTGTYYIVLGRVY